MTNTTIHTATFLALVASATACTGKSGDEAPPQNKITQIEITWQEGATTDIERTDLSYGGDRMKGMRRFYNGQPDGSADLTYGADDLQKIDYLDKDGDRAVRSFTFANGALQRVRYEVPGVAVQEDNYTYDSTKPTLTKEVNASYTQVGAEPETRVARFEYDAADQISRKTVVGGGENASLEYRFTDSGLLERATLFTNGVHDITYNFEYSPDAQLEEMTDTDNRRFELTYDAEGRVEQIRKLTNTGTTTYRYTYGDGQIEGWTFAPLIPGNVSDLFDLTGRSYTSLSPRRGSIDFDYDIPAPPPPTTTASLLVHNASVYTISYVYTRQCGATAWSTTPIATSIPPSTDRNVMTGAGCYDLELLEPGGQSWISSNNTFEAGKTYTLTLN